MTAAVYGSAGYFCTGDGSLGDNGTDYFRHSVSVCYHSDPVVPTEARGPLK